MNTKKINTDRTSALVVEGGAMRGIFAAGVLDYFMDSDHTKFDMAIGVSAGALNLASWLAGQRGRAYEVITNFCRRPDFLKFSKLLKNQSAMNLNWLWNISETHTPLNKEALFNNETEFYAVATSVFTGMPMYVKATPTNIKDLLIATSSLPVLFKDCHKINQQLVADGGLADSIPVKKAYEMGARDITVILSRHWGYCMKPSKAPWVVRSLFRQNKELADTVLNRYHSYNEAIEFLINPPEDVHVTVISPPEEFAVSRLTMNIDKLEEGYIMGLKEAKKALRQNTHQLCHEGSPLPILTNNFSQQNIRL
ncbi:patatin family protein [Vibrio hannami]|uniref:patatin-like phospholipase family protein n=1 Tax=Vibrio hannami TaxID=2717094 RepID=UPI0024103410|nr:patatin family protein [Vibrio hannami]MDG3088559.1 patatin family protein [Vibrio hannami]